MPLKSSILVASAAALGIAGLAVAANSGHEFGHEMTVRLADGEVAHIRWFGDVAPQVSAQSGPVLASAFAPPAWGDFPASPFTELDQIEARMDRDMAVMMRQAPATPAAGGPPMLAASGPAGASSWSMVSTLGGGRMCAMSVQVTSRGPDQPAQVVRKTSGDCGDQTAPPRPAISHAPAQTRAERTAPMPVSYVLPPTR